MTREQVQDRRLQLEPRPHINRYRGEWFVSFSPLGTFSKHQTFRAAMQAAVWLNKRWKEVRGV